MEDLREIIGFRRTDEQHMAGSHVLNGIEISNGQLSSFNGFPFDDVNIRLEGVLAQDAQDERCIIVGNAVRGPLGVLGKIEQIKGLVLVGCVRTGLRIEATEPESKYKRRNRCPSPGINKRPAMI